MRIKERSLLLLLLLLLYQSLFLVPKFSTSGHERGLQISSNRLHSTRIERL